jgi:hypothetical protein
MTSTLPRDLASAALDSIFLLRWHAADLRMRSARPRLPITHPDAPVLILPGVFESPYFLAPLAGVIRTTGRPVHTLATLGRNDGSIVDAAALARDYLLENALHGVSVIAHSKGGLIGKQLMIWPESAEAIRSMIAIATPFVGSRYARYAPTRALREFSPTHQTVVDLGSNRAANARIISVYGRRDPQIPDGSRLDGARNIELDAIGHPAPRRPAASSAHRPRAHPRDRVTVGCPGRAGGPSSRVPGPARRLTRRTGEPRRRR